MKKLITAACCLLVLTASAQKKNKTAEKFAQTILANELQTHLYIVASPEMEGRETGTEGQRKAAEYLKQQFTKIGLAPGNNGSYEQFYPLYKDTLTDAQISINGKSFEFGKDFSFASLRDLYTATLYFNEVVYLKEPDSLIDLKGKVVLIHAAGNTSFNSRSIQQLYKQQPAVVFFVQNNISQMTSNRSRRMFFNLFNSKINPISISVSPEVGKALLNEEFNDAKEMKLKTKAVSTELMFSVTKNLQTFSASNILGVIEGSDKKDEWVVISAHYDHIGIINGKIHPGADDDGSGTVGLLELAEAFAKAKAAGKGPRRNILFLAVSGEEKGLWGSEYYSNHPVYPLEKTSLDINIDMIGRKDDKLNSVDSNNHVYLIGDDKLSSELPNYVDSINNMYIKIITDRKYNDPKDPNRLYFRSDHYNFARKGVPIIFFFDGIHKDYHRPTDTPDKINYDLYEKRTRLVFYLAWDAANRNNMFVRDKSLADVPTR